MVFYLITICRKDEKKSQNYLTVVLVGFSTSLSELAVLVPKLSQLIPLSAQTPVFSPFSMESAVILAECVHRGWVPELTGILPSLAAAGGGGGSICIVMERSIIYRLTCSLRFCGNSSYFYIVKIWKILPPAGVVTLADSWCLSARAKYSAKP